MNSQLTYLIAQQRQIEFDEIDHMHQRKEHPMSPYLYRRLTREKLVQLRQRASTAR